MTGSDASPALTDELRPRAALRGDALRRTLWLGTVAWVFGSVWLHAVAGTPTTNYAQALGASKFQFGVLAALPFLASLLSLPASLLIEATGRRKSIFLWGLYIQRFLWIPIALVPLWVVGTFGPQARGPAILLFLALMFLMHGGQTVGSPAWVSWMADIVPERLRGRYFARRRQWGIVSGVPTALVVGLLLDFYVPGGDRLAMLKWCAGIFIVAAIFGALDIFCFGFVPDVPKAPQKGAHLMAAWREPLHNPQFLWFAAYVATLMFAFASMGQFVTLYILEQVGQSSGRAGRGVNTITQLMLLVAPAVAQLLVLPVWGRAADRVGKRPLLKLAGYGLVPVGIGWCLVGPHSIWLGYVLAAAGAALWVGIEIANFNLVLEMSGTDENGTLRGGSSYVALNTVIISIAGGVGGLVWGAIAELLRDWTWVTPIKTLNFYDALFALSALLRLVAVAVFLPRIHEPEAHRTREALRYMTANIYNNVFNALLQPLRMLGLRRESYPEADEFRRDRPA